VLKEFLRGIDDDVLLKTLTPARRFYEKFIPVLMNPSMEYQSRLFRAGLGLVIARLQQTSNLDVHSNSAGYRESLGVAESALGNLVIATRLGNEHQGVKKAQAKRNIVEMAAQYLLRRQQQHRQPFLFSQFGESYSDTEIDDITREGEQMIPKIDAYEVILDLKDMPNTENEIQSGESDLSFRSDSETPYSQLGDLMKEIDSCTSQTTLEPILERCLPDRWGLVESGS
jgi:hypothetical protein